MKHKYVRHAEFGFIFFPADTEVSHLHIARMLNRTLSTKSVISAGFVWFSNTGQVTVEGRSESLNLSRLADDAYAIKLQLGFQIN